MRSAWHSLPTFACLVVLLVSACGPAADPGWQSVDEPAAQGWVMSTWAASASDVWLVGGAPDAGVAMHFDGATWSERAVPDGTPLLDWAYGFGSDDVLVVGRGGTILHWDGRTLSAEDSGTTEDLWGVWGSSPDDVWAVGGSGFSTATPTLLHRVAGAWQSVAVPTLSHVEVHGLFKVWGSEADDVWVVGQRGTLLHFDGTSWQERLAGTGEDLIAVWGTSRDRVAFVGGRSNGVLITWDGSAFRAIDLAFLPGLSGVWMGSRDAIQVAGVRGTRRTIAWDGTTLREDDLATQLDYHALHGDPGGTLWAVGGNIASVSPYVGLVSRRTLSEGER